MAAFVVVSPDVVADCLARLLDVVVLRQVGLFVFERPEPALDHDIVSPAALAVHALADAVFLQELLVFAAGELASLIRVEDFRLRHFECLAAGLDDHTRVQRVVHLPADDIAAVPVDDGRQVQEAVPDGDVGDIDRPCLVRPVDDRVAQEVGHDLRMLAPLGEVRTRVKGFDAHFAHIACSLPPADVVAAPLQLSCHLAGAPSRIVRMQVVNDGLAVQLLGGVRPRLVRVVRARPVDAEQAGSLPHGDVRLFSLRKASE